MIAVLVLAIVMSAVAAVFSLIVLWANGQSDAPTEPFQGGSLIVVSWLVAGALWLTWWVV